MNIKEENGLFIVSPNGKLDTISAPEFSKKLLELIDKKPKGCIVDLSEVSFLSSSGLQALLSGAKSAKNSGVKYCVCGMNEMVSDVFILSGFDRFIDIFPNKNEAIANL